MTAIGPTKFRTIMIIDDNNIDLYITSRMILKNGFAENILEYSSAINALAYLNQNTTDPSAWPDVILVDIYMPLMSGFEFMEAYALLPENLKAHSRVFIVSSTIDPKDINRIQTDKHITAFHEKPISRDFLSQL